MIKRSMLWMILAFFSVFAGALGQLCFKASILYSNQFGVINMWLLIGIGLYGVALLSWLIVLRFLSLSAACPLLSISYVLVYLGATQWDILNESIKVIHIPGLLFITLGVYLAVKPENQHD